MRAVIRVCSAVLFALVGAASAVAPVNTQQSPVSERWITAWGTSMQGLGTNAISNATVRLIARVTIPGDAVRIRLDNTFGETPVRIAKAYIGHRIQAAAVAAGSNKPISFNGAASVTIPAGGSVMSDAVPMRVVARQDLAVSLYVPDADVKPTQHTAAQTTSYVTATNGGDVAADEARTPFTVTATTMMWLKAIDVLSPSAAGSIVAFGDSITDGTCSTLDGNNRWEDWLSVRLDLGGVPKAVVNEGIGGNTVTRQNLQPPPDSPPGIERLERDVFSHHGVTDVILFMGTNDVRREAPAAQLMTGIEDIVKRVKARGLKITGVTIIPRHNVAPSGTNTGWDGGKTGIRNEVNQWIRTKAGFDAVIDFDQVVRDPVNPNLIYTPFNCGDGIHPSAVGYYEMGKALRLDLFR